MPAPTTFVDPARLTGRVREMIQHGRVHAARPLLVALRKLAAPSAELDELAGMLLLREGRVADALAELDAAIGKAPEAVGLRICRAEARMQINDFAAAAADAAEAVTLSPRTAHANAMLGVILIEMNRPIEAIACLAEAVAADPQHPAYRQGLAEAQERSGDTVAAAQTLREGIRLAPGSVALRIAAIMQAMRQRDLEAAAAIADAARRDGIADACVFGLLGHALSSLGRQQEALDAYTDALKLAPEDPYVRHLVRAGGVLPDAERAPVEYLQAVFDGYAERFEKHLIGLGYRVPGVIRAALLEHLALDPAAGGQPARIGPVLDLGCGTGFLGVVLADLPLGPLTGVDVSAGMLQKAAAKNLYATLHEADLEAFLAGAERDWAVMLAADVLVYFGALERVLSLTHAALRPHGLFVFSVEEMSGETGAAADGGSADRGWRLDRQGRYSHTLDYVRHAAVAAGFCVRELRRETLRHEAGAPVPGLLAVLERVRHDA
jgi:predicted TPR repeat methyltransferase